MTIEERVSRKEQKTEATKQKILEAALEEFSQRGFQGARLDNVAKMSGCNKALVYRHFTDKEGLFKATLRSKFERRSEVRRQVPADLAEALTYWFEETNGDPHFMRLINQEALNYDGDDPVDRERREEHYRLQIAFIKNMQEKGMVSDSMDPKYLFLALTSLVVFPSAFPQIVKMMTGLESNSEAFIAQWNVFLSDLAAQLKD